MSRIQKLNFAERATLCLNASAQHLCQLIADKQTNLCLSADMNHVAELLDLADRVGEEICLLKTHIDILSDFTVDFIKQLNYLAKKHRFLIFEDRKFADIGFTVKQQYAGGLYHIADWADIVNAHTVPGPGTIQGLQEVGLVKNRGLLLLAEMSSKGSLAKAAYTEASVAMAAAYPEFVIGFIAQHQLTENPGLIHLTPGVQFDSDASDRLGQQYISPEQAINQNGADIIIVGRGISRAKDPAASAQHYRKSAWKAYLACC